jgi:hypothetical protein
LGFSESCLFEKENNPFNSKKTLPRVLKPHFCERRDGILFRSYAHVKANAEADCMNLKVYKPKPISLAKNPILATQKTRQIIFLTKQKNTSRVSVPLLHSVVSGRFASS